MTSVIWGDPSYFVYFADGFLGSDVTKKAKERREALSWEIQSLEEDMAHQIQMAEHDNHGTNKLRIHNWVIGKEGWLEGLEDQLPEDNLIRQITFNIRHSTRKTLADRYRIAIQGMTINLEGVKKFPDYYRSELEPYYSSSFLRNVYKAGIKRDRIPYDTGFNDYAVKNLLKLLYDEYHRTRAPPTPFIERLGVPFVHCAYYTKS